MPHAEDPGPRNKQQLYRHAEDPRPRNKQQLSRTHGHPARGGRREEARERREKGAREARGGGARRRAGFQGGVDLVQRDGALEGDVDRLAVGAQHGHAHAAAQRVRRGRGGWHGRARAPFTRAAKDDVTEAVTRTEYGGKVGDCKGEMTRFPQSCTHVTATRMSGSWKIFVVSVTCGEGARTRENQNRMRGLQFRHSVERYARSSEEPTPHPRVACVFVLASHHLPFFTCINFQRTRRERSS